MSEINDLNEVFEEEMDDATVITVPIDTTLTHSGEAAEAKTVGDALALKADKSELQATVSVDGQSADAQGEILLYGEHIPMSSTDERTVQEAVAAAAGRTGADIPISGAAGAPTIQAAIADGLAVTADEIPLAEGETSTVADELARLESTKGTVKTVNGLTPGSSGNVQIEQVEYARNLVAGSAQQGAGVVLERTTGGQSTIGSGSAQMQSIRGVMFHDGIVEEVIEVVPSNDSLSLAVDNDTLRSAMGESGDEELEYSSGSWSESPATYGITVTGTAQNGDTISIHSVEGSRGTITTATPTGFKATGYNLYQHLLGYARVLKYDYPYYIGGSKSKIEFSYTPSGARITLDDDNGVFDIPADGYVHVTGGSASDTYITTVWTDWTQGKDTQGAVAFEGYTENGFDMSALFGSGKAFENGMTAVGSVYDEINFETGKAINRIERMLYSEENIEALEMAGRAWEADESYIYAVRTAVDTEAHTYDLATSLTGVYTAHDHGLEIITGSTVGVYCLMLYGSNLVRKLERDVLTISQVANNVTTNSEGMVLDAMQGKALYDMWTYNKGDSVYFPIILFGYASSSAAIYIYFPVSRRLISTNTVTADFGVSGIRDMDGNAVTIPSGITITAARHQTYVAMIKITGLSGLTANKAYRVTIDGNRRAVIS